MKTKLLSILISTALTLAAAGCASKAENTMATAPADNLTGEAQALPAAIVYKTNGDYYDNVPVTLNADRTALASWPAPTDINDTSVPLKFAEGWLLDRRGVSSTTAFLDYTYKEYRKLPASEATPSKLMAHIIPGSEVTVIRRLPIPLWKALEDPVEASKLVDASPVVYQAK